LILEQESTGFRGDEHRAHLMNYLRATGLRVGLLIKVLAGLPFPCAPCFPWL